MSAKFEIKRVHQTYQITLKAPNGQIIARGNNYKTKEGVENAIASIKKNADRAEMLWLWE